MPPIAAHDIENAAQIAAICGLRQRCQHASISWLTACGERIARVHLPGGYVEVMPSGEIVGDIDSAMLEPAPAVILADPADYADSWESLAEYQAHRRLLAAGYRRRAVDAQAAPFATAAE